MTIMIQDSIQEDLFKIEIDSNKLNHEAYGWIKTDVRYKGDKLVERYVMSHSDLIKLIDRMAF